MRRVTIAALLLIVGYIVGQHVFQPKVKDEHHNVTMIVLSESMEPNIQSWRREVGRRLPDAVVIAVHGNDDSHGVWNAYPDIAEPMGPFVAYRKLPPIPVSWLVKHYRERYPDRPIVLLSCNPGHHTLNDPNVYYALDDIWIIPDRALSNRDFPDPGTVGNIFEFTHN